jgi:hypothetical protein
MFFRQITRWCVCPVYQDARGERLDYYYSRRDRRWMMRYRKPGQLIVTQMFEKGRSRREDLDAADRRLAKEARRRGMALSHFEARAM